MSRGQRNGAIEGLGLSWRDPPVPPNGSIMRQAAPYAGPVSTEADEPGADGGAPPPPTSAQVAQGVIDLLAEVDEAFSSDR